MGHQVCQGPQMQTSKKQRWTAGLGVWGSGAGQAQPPWVAWDALFQPPWLPWQREKLPRQPSSTHTAAALWSVRGDGHPGVQQPWRRRPCSRVRLPRAGCRSRQCQAAARTQEKSCTQASPSGTRRALTGSQVPQASRSARHLLLHSSLAPGQPSQPQWGQEEKRAPPHEKQDTSWEDTCWLSMKDTQGQALQGASTMGVPGGSLDAGREGAQELEPRTTLSTLTQRQPAPVTAPRRGASVRRTAGARLGVCWLGTEGQVLETQVGTLPRSPAGWEWQTCGMCAAEDEGPVQGSSRASATGDARPEARQALGCLGCPGHALLPAPRVGCPEASVQSWPAGLQSGKPTLWRRRAAPGSGVG